MSGQTRAQNGGAIGSAMNVSFRMNITTSGAPHNGILFSTGIQTGQFTAGAAANSRPTIAADTTGRGNNRDDAGDESMLSVAPFYDANSAQNIMEMWRQAQLPPSKSADQRAEITNVNDVHETAYAERKTELKGNVQQFSIERSDHNPIRASTSDNVAQPTSYASNVFSSTSGGDRTYHADRIASEREKGIMRNIPITIINSALPPLPRRSTENFRGTSASNIYSSSAQPTNNIAARTDLPSGAPYIHPATNITQDIYPVNRRREADDAPAFSELEREPYGSISGRATKNLCQDSNQFNHQPILQPSIKLNVFDQDLAYSKSNNKNMAVELHVPSQVEICNNDASGSDDEGCDLGGQPITTTTTTVEIFRERLNDARHPVDYFRLPAAPLRGAGDQRVDLVRAHGPTYEVATRTETRLGTSRTKSSGGSSRVRWEDSSQSRPFSAMSSSQPSLNYIVKEPSSLSGFQSNSYSLKEKESSVSGMHRTDSQQFPSYQLHDDFSNDNSRDGHGFRANSSLNDLNETSFSSVWNLADGSNEVSNNEEEDEDSASVATILRYHQRTEKSPQPPRPPSSVSRSGAQQLIRRAPSRGVSENDSAIYSRITTPSPRLFRQNNNNKQSARAPPLPPKRYPMRRTNSQPNNIGNYEPDSERHTPPRPRTQKPPHLRRYTRPTMTSVVVNPFPIFELPNARRHQPAGNARSASSNEIFKLYQTRDCLGNVLYEM